MEGAGANSSSSTKPPAAEIRKLDLEVAASGDFENSPIATFEEIVGSDEDTTTLEAIGVEEAIVTVGEEDEDSEEEITLGAAVAGISNWFSGAISSAKEKSSEMFEYLKEDLTEFSHTVSEASKDLKDKLKIDDQTIKSAVESVTSTATLVFDQMSTIFGVGPDDGDDDDEAIVVQGASSEEVVDRVQAKIYSLAVEEDAFLKDPEDIKSYEVWLRRFDLDQKYSEMDKLMTANPHLQLHYSHLVPEKVSHLVFWHRFYYRVHEIQVAEQEREELVRKQEFMKKSAKEREEGKDSEAEEESFIDANDDSAGEGFTVVTREDLRSEFKMD